jgi:hypothetical protein
MTLFEYEISSHCFNPHNLNVFPQDFYIPETSNGELVIMDCF